MNYTLENHDRKYGISCKDGLFSLGTGVTGITYAKRHWNLAKKEGIWGHRVIAVLEAIPVFGALAALLERVAVFVYNKFFKKDTPSSHHQVLPSLHNNNLKKFTSSDQEAPAVRSQETAEETLQDRELSSQDVTPAVSEIDRPNIQESAKRSVDPKNKPGSLPWRPSATTKEKAIEKMLKNARKAIEEHIKKGDDRFGTYASVEEALPSIEAIRNPTASTPLVLEHVEYATQGPTRPTMEDAHFYAENDQGIITGIFDGHGGKGVAEFANEKFEKDFLKTLNEVDGNVHHALEKLIHEIHEEVKENYYNEKLELQKYYEFIKELVNKECPNDSEELKEKFVQALRYEHIMKMRFISGATAVISVIDKKTHLIYTATLGDCEANIYRKINGELKSIPLSPVRDWSCEKEALRASIYTGRDEIAKDWLTQDPKRIRFPKKGDPLGDTNVSRAIGDIRFTGTDEKPGLIHKPKITVNLWELEDTLILACDGLKDFAYECAIVKKIKNTNQKDNNLAQVLAELTYSRMGMFEGEQGDNVTVIVVQAKR